MPFYDAFGDVKAEARSLTTAGISLPETIEDPRQVLGRDAGPGIADLDSRVEAGFHRANRDASPLGRELQRVADEVREDLPDSFGIAPKAEVAVADLLLERDRFLG